MNPMHLGDELCLSIKGTKLSTKVLKVVLIVVTEFFAPEFAYNKLCSNNDQLYRYVCVFRHPRGADFLLLLCSRFFHFVTLVQLIFHQSRCTETASNDRLYTYNILPYQPGAYEAVYLHCHSRLVTTQTGRI